MLGNRAVPVFVEFFESLDEVLVVGSRKLGDYTGDSGLLEMGFHLIINKIIIENTYRERF